MTRYRVYKCDDHDGRWPVPRASVVVARDKRHARRLLDKALREVGLKTSKEVPYTLHEVQTDVPNAVIINDGEY